jgi:hypothetical protein
MRKILVFVAALAIAIPASAQNPATPPDNPLVIFVGVFTPGGGMAAQDSQPNSDRIDGVVATDGCRVSAQNSDLPLPTHSPDVWQFHGESIKLGPDQATVRLSWMHHNVSAASQGGLRTLTLPLDELVTLETVSPDPTPSCVSPRVITFGAKYTHRMPPPIFDKTLGAREGGSGNGTAARQTYEAELWLVHSVPGKPDFTTETSARVGAQPTQFSFSPLTLAVPGGHVAVNVNGQLWAPGGMLIFKANRAAHFEPAGRPVRDRTKPDAVENATVTHKLPGPDDVLEFLMPALQLPEVPEVPGTLTVRLRLRPTR